MLLQATEASEVRKRARNEYDIWLRKLLHHKKHNSKAEGETHDAIWCSREVKDNFNPFWAIEFQELSVCNVSMKRGKRERSKSADKSEKRHHSDAEYSRPSSALSEMAYNTSFLPGLDTELGE